MANEDRLRTGFVIGTITDDPLTAIATTVNSAELGDLAAVGATEHAALVLDPNEVEGAAEIVYVTAHTASASSATVSRGQEGTTAREHPLGTIMVHGPTAREVPGRNVDVRRTAGDLTHALTTWGDLSTALDLVLPGAVYEGDQVRVGVSGRWGNEAVEGFLDVASLNNSDVEVNYWGTDGAEGGSSEGVQAWHGPSGVVMPVGAPVQREVVAGDLRTGDELKLRFRIRCGTAATKTLNATANIPLQVWAENLGPRHTE